LGKELEAGQIGRALTYVAAMLISLTFHEAAHALIATWKGDTTAKERGRLSLNPWRHVDFFGTIALPLAGALAQLPIIGWAKPVPVNLACLKRPRWDHLQIAAAGPLANLLLGAAALTGATCLAHVVHRPEPGSGAAMALGLLTALMWVNAYLAVFNLLPVPPLDGGTVAASLLPERLSLAYQRRLAPYGFLLLLALMALHGLDWLPGVAAGYLAAVRALIAQIAGI
jgi:Zn-dependent protease